jgi:glyoxylase-like metal-dependent hydrolase (beta-lactamase superfamily II)
MAQLSLKQIRGGTYYVPAPALIGLFERDGHAVLIDSGNDREAGRGVNRLLEERGLKLDLIINTHSNADHIGGNAFLQKKTGCRIAATRLEAAFIQDPVLEPAFLYGGSPLHELQSKFLMAKPSTVTDVIPSTGTILDTGLESVPLPGHFFDMIGVRTPDNVLFLADCLFSERIITKYHLFFLYDLEAQLETLRRVKEMQADWFVPSHAGPLRAIDSLIEKNLHKIEEILQFVEEMCEQPVTTEEVLAEICSRYAVALNAEQYVLVSSTMRSYLAFLKNTGRLEILFEGGRLLWRRPL